jgi:sigma-E factor negative regulatory protein RseB
VTRRAASQRAAIALLVLGALLVPLPNARAGGDDEGEALLGYARRVSSSETFAGIVEVRWRDDSGREHVDRVGARSVDGTFVVGVASRQVVGHGVQRSANESGVSGAQWSAVAVQSAPRPGAAWQLEVSGRERVAGRTSTVVVARDDNGRVRARFAVDRQTGQLLRREVLDRHDHVVRSIGFVKIVTGAVTPAVPNVRSDARAAPVAISDVPDGFVSRDVVGAQYHLLGRYRHPDGVVQLYYGDGLFTLSIFEQRGRVDWGALPPGHGGSIGTVRARTYSTAVGTVVVWAHHDLVLTAVGDGPPDAVVAAAADLNGVANASSWIDSVTDFVLGPFRWE